MKRFLLLLPLALVIGCQRTPEVKQVKLAKDTPVELILLKQIEAGREDVGDEVPFIAAEDVKGEDGSVVIPKGSFAKATVTASRNEGTLSALTNRPARLGVDFESIVAADGTLIQLEESLEENEEPFHFTRENTGKVDLGEKLDEVWESEATQQLLTRIHASFQGEGDLSFDDPETKEALKDISRQLSLNNLTKAVEQDKLNEVEEIMREIQRGGTIATVAGGEPLLALNAVVELANVAGGVGSRISRMLKGRTIKAYPGTTVTAYVETDTVIQLTPKS